MYDMTLLDGDYCIVKFAHCGKLQGIQTKVKAPEGFFLVFIT